jgi:tetratricopeptide (TPR) repeat protein
MQPHQRRVTERVVDEVRKFALDGFVLAEELTHLEAVFRACAPEAVVFYSARILDALASEALRRLGQEPSPNVFSNLEALDFLGQVGTATCHWAHSLRRLGNLVRHVGGRLAAGDDGLSALFAERWLDWFFCRFAKGHGLPALTADRGPLRLTPGDELAGVLRSLEALDDKGPPPPPDSAFFRTPVTAAVLAEVLLSRSEKGDPAPFCVLEPALQRFPGDLRLRQLTGLYWSREGQLTRALEWLDPLFAQNPNDDETAGITAGVWKKRWRADRSDVESLRRSYRAYWDAWKQSGRKSAYAGINTAATALWLGQKDESCRVAAEVDSLLRKRAATLPEDLRASWRRRAYWHWVTLAEARLLQGDWDGARELYRDAFTHHADRVADVRVTKEQRDEILRALGLPPMDP